MNIKERITINLHDAIQFAMDSMILKKHGEDLIPYIVGTPGGGKTKMIQHFIKQLNIENKYNVGFLAYEPGLERVEKFGGIPDFVWVKTQDSETENERKELHTIWSIPQMIVEIKRKSKQYKDVIVLFDDWHLCQPNIQQIGYEMFTHHSLNGHKIPSNAHFILAGNEKSTAGAKIQMSGIRNRCKVFYTVSNVQYWIDNYAIPNTLHPAGISFFMMKENHHLFHEEESTVEQWASPRSWTSAFNNLSFYEKIGRYNENDSILLSLIQGCVGPKASQSFWTYYKIFSKIDAKGIFKTGKFEIPTDGIQRFAFGAAIASELYNLGCDLYANAKEGSDKFKKEFDRFGKIYFEIMNELYDKCPEIALMTITMISNKNKNEKFNTINGLDFISNLNAKQYLSDNLVDQLTTKTTQLRKFSLNGV